MSSGVGITLSNRKSSGGFKDDIIWARCALVFLGRSSEIFVLAFCSHAF
jgi:hypothetical protein